MTPFTNRPLPDIPVLKITSDGEESTTFRKAMDDLTQKDDMAKRLRTRSEIHTRQAAQILREWRALEDQREATRRLANRIRALVKAEISRRKTAEAVAKKEKLKRKSVKARRRAEEAKFQKAQAERSLADLTARAETLRAEVTAQVDGITERVNRVVVNAERSYDEVARQRDFQAVAELAKQDQMRADWAFKASQTNDPILREAYLAKAAGRSDED